MNKFIINKSLNVGRPLNNFQDDISDIYDMDKTVEPEEYEDDDEEDGFDNQEEEIDMQEYQENFTDTNPDFLQFKQNIKDWIALDDDIRTLQEALKERRKKKGSLTPKISLYMNKFKINDLNTNDGKLKFARGVSYTAISKKYIIQRITDFLKDEDKTFKMLDYIYNHREKKERVYLRRVMPRKKKEDKK